MPGGDGTGPMGGSGRGSGRGFYGRGFGQGRSEVYGPGGYCVCPACGHRIPHVATSPCAEIRCPACGIYMTREQQ